MGKIIEKVPFALFWAPLMTLPIIIPPQDEGLAYLKKAIPF
jgi:hypothetical protein